MSDEALFKVTGAVVRTYVPASGKVAFLTLDVLNGERSRKYDLRAFDASIVATIGELAKGATVEIKGTLDVEPVKTKTGEQVLVDGFAKWVPMLVARSVTTSAAASRQAPRVSAPRDGGGQQRGNVAPVDDIDDVPFVVLE